MKDNSLVLVVEDNPDDELLTVRALRNCGVTTRLAVAHDGAEALDFLIRGKPLDGVVPNTRPDLILLDLKLPKVSGIELLKELDHNEITRSTPVVVLSSSDEQRDINECFQYGANSYVCKPVDFAAYTETVRGLARYWLSINRLPGHTVRAS